MAKFRENRRISYVMKKSCKVLDLCDLLGRLSRMIGNLIEG